MARIARERINNGGSANKRHTLEYCRGLVSSTMYVLIVLLITGIHSAPLPENDLDLASGDAIDVEALPSDPLAAVEGTEPGDDNQVYRTQTQAITFPKFVFTTGPTTLPPTPKITTYAPPPKQTTAKPGEIEYHVDVHGVMTRPADDVFTTAHVPVVPELETTPASTTPSTTTTVSPPVIVDIDTLLDGEDETETSSTSTTTQSTTTTMNDGALVEVEEVTDKSSTPSTTTEEDLEPIADLLPTNEPSSEQPSSSTTTTEKASTIGVVVIVDEDDSVPSSSTTTTAKSTTEETPDEPKIAHVPIFNNEEDNKYVTPTTSPGPEFTTRQPTEEPSASHAPVVPKVHEQNGTASGVGLEKIEVSLEKEADEDIPTVIVDPEDNDSVNGTRIGESKQEGLSSGARTGIAIGCIVGFWIILGPLVCLICKMRDKKRDKEEQKERDAREKASNGLVEEMVKAELQTKTPTANGDHKKAQYKDEGPEGEAEPITDFEPITIGNSDSMPYIDADANSRDTAL